MRSENYITFNLTHKFMKFFLASLLFFLTIEIYSQTERIVPVVIPSIEYNSNSHIGGIADIGSVASTFYPDAGLYQNPALLSNNHEYVGVNISYMPMLSEVISNAGNISVNGFYAIDSKNILGYTFSRFSFGSVMLTDENGYEIATVYPQESYHKFSYSRAISDYVSVGLGIKLIDADMGNDLNINTFAVDLGFSNKKKYKLSKQFDLNTNLGSSINNLGPKVSYDYGITHNFIPANLKLGVLLNPEYKISNKFNLNLEFAVQLEKDLVPSEPVYASDNSQLIIRGYNPDISSFQALYQSFYDSPEGFGGELKEIRRKFGTELRANYNNKIYVALRFGRYNDTSMRDNNNLTTTGIGIGLFGFSLDYKRVKPDLTSNPNGNFAFTLGYRVNLKGKPFRF
ncbi:MAG: PorV/PorQ family protein [Paludibacter sp.]|nr:PorV/PorQ family protein [Paludibacter sp.]